MLYERWLEVVRAKPDQLALWDGRSGRRYTFQELMDVAAGLPEPEGSIHCVSGAGAEFIISLLRGWRHRRVSMPLEPGQAPPRIEAAPAGDIVHLKTTSATTGASRMIAFTAEQLEADCEQVVGTMGLDPAFPNVGTISLAHSYGFSNLILPLLLRGIPMLMAGSALPESVRAAIDQAERVALPSVPALWQAWKDAGMLSDRIRIAISAGAPLPLALEREVFDVTGVKIHNFYGSSECGGIAYDRTEEPRDDPALAGTPMQGVDIGLNEDRCVTVRSRAVGKGYWPEPDAALSEGRFQTGDLGELIEGRVFLRGRACDRINVAGRKVVPEEVERALCHHPAVRDCLVFGVPADSIRNETIVACVVSDGQLSSRELIEFVQMRLPSWQVPREWWMVPSLGANERGKRSRSEWRDRYLRASGSTLPVSDRTNGAQRV